MLHRIVVSFDPCHTHSTPNNNLDELEIGDDLDEELIDNGYPDGQPKNANHQEPIGYPQPITVHQSDMILQDQTAAQITDTTGYAPFICPVCGDILDHTFSLHLFHRHFNTPIHWEYFASHGIMCQFDCGRGFPDEHHRFMHYNNGSCQSMQKLATETSYKCPTKATQNCTMNRTRNLTPYALAHWVSYHGKQHYKKHSSFDCAIFKLGFPSQAMLVAHLQQQYGVNPKPDLN